MDLDHQPREVEELLALLPPQLQPPRLVLLVRRPLWLDLQPLLRQAVLQQVFPSPPLAVLLVLALLLLLSCSIRYPRQVLFPL